MKGAREYAELFTTGIYGRLYIVSSSHARGKTFHIYVTPEGATGRSDDDVEVYGVVSGQPGWTECYGWLREGPWQEDFDQLVLRMRNRQESDYQLQCRLAEERATAREARAQALLATYKKVTP